MAYKEVPIFTTKAQIKASMYDIISLKAKFVLPPCRSITKINAQPREVDREFAGHPYQILVKYPGQLKIIKQSKAVNSHAFIGNIGGYIGLFLGKGHNKITILQ